MSGPTADGVAASVLAAMPYPVLVVGPGDEIFYVNIAGEQFFETGAPALAGRALADLVPDDSPLFSLLAQVRAHGYSVSEYDVTLTVTRAGTHRLSLTVAPMGEEGQVVISFHELSIARKIDRQLVHRSAARSVTGLSRMLAHEVKNPLSGIRGAAQLLEQTAGESDRTLTRLICEETDRICALVDRMAIFADNPPLDRGAVNVHEVLKRVRLVAQAGFARHVRFTERYDPSLPPVYGNRDQLIQVFLNLVKNAAEAAPKVGGEIVLHTAFQHGLRLALPGGQRRVQLPLVVAIQDNGPGVPEEIAGALFDPFVSARRNGSGLGLALVAKLIGDHSGVVEFDSEPGRTVFRVLLPTVPTTRATKRNQP